MAFKTFTGVTSNLIRYSVTKFIPATIISIVANTAPVTVIVFAYLILKEQIRKFDIFIMFFTLAGIFVIIIGGNDSESQKAEPSFPIWVLYLILAINPFLYAGGTIAMRKMAKFTDATVSWYL